MPGMERVLGLVRARTNLRNSTLTDVLFRGKLNTYRPLQLRATCLCVQSSQGHCRHRDPRDSGRPAPPGASAPETDRAPAGNRSSETKKIIRRTPGAQRDNFRARGPGPASGCELASSRHKTRGGRLTRVSRPNFNSISGWYLSESHKRTRALRLRVRFRPRRSFRSRSISRAGPQCPHL
jgi:hypothetical protein